MKLKALPTESVIQLLSHFAEHPALSRLLEGLDNAVALNEVKRALFELAGILKESIAADAPDTISSINLQSDPLLSVKTKELLSCLSPKEEKKLLAKFGL